MSVALNAWPQAALVLTTPALNTIGLWTARCVLLSLSLALIWITLVSVAQRLKSSRQIPAIYATPPCSATLRFSFDRWQRETGELSFDLGSLEGSLSATRSGPAETFTRQSASPALTKKDRSPLAARS
jgi:hypothetical protein